MAKESSFSRLRRSHMMHFLTASEEHEDIKVHVLGAAQALELNC
jgi:hypothetical protein